jgi:hypothetical protein
MAQFPETANPEAQAVIDAGPTKRANHKLIALPYSA